MSTWRCSSGRSRCAWGCNARAAWSPLPLAPARHPTRVTMTWAGRVRCGDRPNTACSRRHQRATTWRVTEDRGRGTQQVSVAVPARTVRAHAAPHGYSTAAQPKHMDAVGGCATARVHTQGLRTPGGRTIRPLTVVSAIKRARVLGRVPRRWMRRPRDHNPLRTHP